MIDRLWFVSGSNDHDLVASKIPDLFTFLPFVSKPSSLCAIDQIEKHIDQSPLRIALLQVSSRRNCFHLIEEDYGKRPLLLSHLVFLDAFGFDFFDAIYTFLENLTQLFLSFACFVLLSHRSCFHPFSVFLGKNALLCLLWLTLIRVSVLSLLLFLLLVHRLIRSYDF